MRPVLIAALGLMLAPLAHGKDYYIHIRKGLNLVLTAQPCAMSQITGPGWQRSTYQVSAAGGVHTLSPGCWKRLSDKVYVIDEVAPFWIAPDMTGGSTYYRLDSTGCGFKVPGLSFSDWHSGRMVGITKLPSTGLGRAVVFDNGPICWRSVNHWFEKIDLPQVYSAFEVKSPPLP